MGETGKKKKKLENFLRIKHKGGAKAKERNDLF